MPEINLVPKIYGASKTKHSNIWKELRDSGVNIISTWADESGQNESLDLRDLIHRCVKESSECDYLILYIEENEILKCALVEVGCALSNGKTVIVVGESVYFSSETFFSHKNVWRSPSISEALSYISKSWPSNKAYKTVC